MSDQNNRAERSVENWNDVRQKWLSLPVSKGQIPEHAEQRDKIIDNDLQTSESYTSLKGGGHVESELKGEDPIVGVISTFCSSGRKESIDESNMMSVSVSSRIESGYAVPLVKPGHYKLESFNVERQKDLASRGIAPKPTGLADSHSGKDCTCNANHLADGSVPNCSISGIKRTVGPDTEFGCISSMKCVSDVDILCKGRVQSKEPCGSSHHRKSQRIVLRNRALHNTILHPSNVCIRPCYVKLIKLKYSEYNTSYINVMSEQFSSNVICGNRDGSIGHEEMYLSSVSDVPVGSENGKQLNNPMAQGRHVATSKTGNKTDIEVNETSMQKTESAKDKIFHIQENHDTNSVQIGDRKRLRRKIGKFKEPRSKKLLNEKLPDQLNLLNKLKPVSISLERLNQCVLEKYSVSSSSVNCTSMPHKSAGLTQQETLYTGKNVESNSGAYRKRITRLENVKYSDCDDNILCLDGVTETSSSDDSSESKSADHFKQLEKSPVTKKPRRQEEIMHKSENKLTQLQQQDAHYSHSSVVTTLQKPRFGTPLKNLKWMNTTSSAKTRSPSTSPRKALYPPLSIRIQKSPKNRTENSKEEFQEKPSPLSELKNHRESSSRLSGEETRPKHVADQQNLTSVKHIEDKSTIFEENMRKSSTSLGPSHCVPIAEDGTGTRSSGCHDARTSEGQSNSNADKHRYAMRALSANCSICRLLRVLGCYVAWFLSLWSMYPYKTVECKSQ
jgi:hypothetical protein